MKYAFVIFFSAILLTFTSNVSAQNKGGGQQKQYGQQVSEQKKHHGQQISNQKKATNRIQKNTKNSVHNAQQNKTQDQLRESLKETERFKNE